MKKIYEDDRFLLIEPLNKEASCLYGKGTRWCISATESENYFERYANQGQRFVFIIDKKPEGSTPEWLKKIAISFSQQTGASIQGFNARDTMMTPDEVASAIPENIAEVLNKYIGTNVFEKFSQEKFLQGLPETAAKKSRRQKFVLEASSENLVEALEKLYLPPRQEYLNDFLYFASDFSEMIIDELIRRQNQPVELLGKAYRLCKRNRKERHLLIDTEKMAHLLRIIVSKKLPRELQGNSNQATVAYILLEPFVNNPQAFERIISAKGVDDNFVEAFLEKIQAAKGLFTGIERTIKSQPEVTSSVLKIIAATFKKYGYDFSNMIEPLQ